MVLEAAGREDLIARRGRAFREGAGCGMEGVGRRDGPARRTAS